MKWRGAIAAAAALAATSAFADGAAQDVRDAMRAAMLEHAPLPSGPAALPDRTAPVMPRVQLARSKADADRAARAHAGRNAAAAHAEAANHAAMRSMMMSGSRSGGGGYGCDNQPPADMMKSRGMMPGGGTMPGHSSGDGSGGGNGDGGPSGSGMPGGGMLAGPGATSTGAPSGAPIGALQSSARRWVDAARR